MFKRLTVSAVEDTQAAVGTEVRGIESMTDTVHTRNFTQYV